MCCVFCLEKPVDGILPTPLTELLSDLIRLLSLCCCQRAYLMSLRAVVEWCNALGAHSRKWISVKFPNRSLNHHRGAYVCMRALRESCCLCCSDTTGKLLRMPPPISFPPPFLVSSPLCFQQIFTQIVGTSLLKLGGGENSRNDCWRGRKVGGRDGAMFRAVSSGFYPCQPDTVPFAHRVINPAWWLL